MKNILLLLSALFLSEVTLAAELNLFDEVRSTPTNTREEARSRTRPSTRASKSSPEFVLLGTSNIGGKYKATLKTRDGKTIVIAAKPKTNVEISGHSGYKIVDIKSRRVSIMYPEDSDCVAFNDKGVSCNEDGNIAQLSLALAPVLETARSTSRDASSSEETNLEENAVDGNDNPFSNALRAAANRDRSTATDPAVREQNNSRAGFQPRRIDPADVPPGKRIVTTPFGDRLVDL